LKVVAGIIILRTGVCVSFKLLPNIGYDMNKLSAAINFRFIRNKQKVEEETGLEIVPHKTPV
jgi:hypothetical protein